MRRNHRIVSVAVIVAVGVNADGRREVLGMDIGPSEAETFWTEFLRKLRRRGLRGVKLVVSDAHEGIKAAVAKLMNATWQRCRVHTMRNALAHAGKSSRRVVSAFMATAFAQDSADAAKAQWRRVADQLRPKLPKLAAFMDEAENDVLAYMSFPADHWPKIHSTNGLERLNGEIKRRTDVVGIFPNEDAIVRLVGAILLEQNDEWAVQRARYMTLETMAALSDDPVVGLPAMVDLTNPAYAGKSTMPGCPLHHAPGHNPLPSLGADRPEDVGRGGSLVFRGARPRAPFGPSPGDLVLLADAGLVGEPDLYAIGVDAAFAPDLLQARGKTYGMARPSLRRCRLAGVQEEEEAMARSLSALSPRDRDLKHGIGARGWRGASLVSS